MKYFIIFYVVPAIVNLYYEVRELRWSLKHYRYNSRNVWAMLYSVLIPVFNFIMAFLYVSYDLKVFGKRKKK